MESYILIGIILISGWIPPAIGLAITWWLARKTIEKAELIRSETRSEMNRSVGMVQAVATRIQNQVKTEAETNRAQTQQTVAALEGRIGSKIAGIRIEIPEETKKEFRDSILHAIDGKVGNYVRNIQNDFEFSPEDIQQMQTSENPGINMGEIIRAKVMKKIAEGITNFSF